MSTRARWATIVLAVVAASGGVLGAAASVAVYRRARNT
jgi:hypothetical protein